MAKKLESLEIKNIGEGEIEISAELSVADFETFREKALKNLGEEVKLDGFRPGHIPADVLAGKLGEDKILAEMAELAISEVYIEIINEKKLAVIGRPEVIITKLAKDNPLGFKIKTATTPEITLGDYKKIAQKINAEPQGNIEVKEEEVSRVLEDLRQSRASASHAGHEHKEGEACTHETTLPELNDDFAKSLGQFQNLEELKAKIKENLTLEQERKNKDKKRVAIISETIKDSKISIAPILVETEKDKMLAEMEAQIGYMGLKFDDYLAHLKKTKEELRDSWSETARERVAFGLVLAEIADKEKIGPSDEELKNELDYLKSQYKDVAEDRLRSYASGLITNEKVFEFLEGLK